MDNRVRALLITGSQSGVEFQSAVGILTSGVDLTFATPWPRIRIANVKSETPLETYIC